MIKSVIIRKKINDWMGSEDEMKKVLAILLSVIVMLGGFGASVSAESLEAKADRLNQLNILKGDGKSYNLVGTLTRQEAATFIVRLLGMENKVLSNTETLSKIDFKDLTSKDWSAPYVGYCVRQGIINGYTDGTFRPKGKLDMQAFGKLLLTSLGYEYHKDFKWEETLSKAESIGLMTKDEINASKSNPFTRGDVIRLLDRALTMNHAVTKEAMVLGIAKNGQVSEQVLANLGFVKRIGKNTVSEIKELKAGQYQIRFSTPPKTFSANHVKIVEEGGRNLQVKSLGIGEKATDYILNTDIPAENMKYKIRIQDAVDQEGLYFVTFEQEFVAYRKGFLESDYFRIAGAHVMDSRTLEIAFTHPIMSDMERTAYYSLVLPEQRSLSFSEFKVILAGNQKVLLKTENPVFEDGKTYHLRVDGNAVSQMGVRLNKGKGDDLRFEGKSKEKPKLDITGIELLDRQTLRMTVSKKIDAFYVDNFAYDILEGNNPKIAMKKTTLTKNDEEGAILILEPERSLIEGRKYKLAVNIMRAEENKEEEISRKEYSFDARVIGNQSYELHHAEYQDPYRVGVLFDRLMDETTATNPQNYTVRRASTGAVQIPTAVHYNPETNYITLYFDKAIQENSATDYILSTKTAIKGANGENRKEEGRKTFTVYPREEEPFSVEAKYLGDNSVVIRTSQPIAKQTLNLDTNNYRIYEKTSSENFFINGVIYINESCLVLRVNDNLSPNKKYFLEIKNMIKYNGVTEVKNLPETEIIILP